MWRYWTKGEGLKRWRGSPHPWTALHRALLDEGVPAHEADGLATNIYHAVTGTYPAHAKSVDKKVAATATPLERVVLAGEPLTHQPFSGLDRILAARAKG